VSSLYERLGGSAAVDEAVGLFYRRVLRDDRVNAFFEGMDMHAQARKQTLFLTKVFGGPDSYDGDDMRTAHAHLGLDDKQFDAIVEHLVATLTEMGIAAHDVEEAARLANAFRDDVLDR
jgi:hemoglobin